MACPVCFSPVEPAVRESLNIGILVLLAVTGGVLTCFARFFVALARRSRAAAHLVQHTETSVRRVFSEPATSAGPEGPALRDFLSGSSRGRRSALKADATS
jgi:hypothetical protein